nr:MAG TPA: hypothetical protein [Caudoviricetes sp.]DAX81851.1 MAG TPA: hypothetical protein [Caudoviricetes sp.]
MNYWKPPDYLWLIVNGQTKKRRLFPLFVIWWLIATTSVRIIRFTIRSITCKSSYIQS